MLKYAKHLLGSLDILFHLLQVSDSKFSEDIDKSRERLRTMCCPEFTPPTRIDASQRAASLLVHSVLGNLLPREAMLKEASIHMTKRRNEDDVCKLEHAQILDILKPWVSSPSSVNNDSAENQSQHQRFDRALFDEMITYPT